MDAPPYELVEMYCAHTPFYQFLTARIPFEIPRELFASHVFICAPPRHGKTQLLSYFTARFLQDPDPPALFVLDPHGDYFTKLKERVPPERLVELDPETNPPPLNFLDFSSGQYAFQSFQYLMSALSGGLTDKHDLDGVCARRL